VKIQLRLIHFLAFAILGMVVPLPGTHHTAVAAVTAARQTDLPPHSALPVIDQVHTSWTASAGAPAGIIGIAQTPDGWIWIGGRSGLYKFDGVHFHRTTGEEAALGTNVSAMGVLADGRLWVGYRYGGLTLREGGRMRHFSPDNAGLPTGGVWAAATDATGRLWLGTTAGLYYFDGRWRPAEATLGVPAGRVHAIALDRDGVLWIRCETGLFALPKGKSRFERKETLSGFGILVRHPDGSLWTNDQGLDNVHLIANGDRGRPLEWKKSLKFTSFLFDQEGYMWKATVEGLGVARAGDTRVHMATQLTGIKEGLSGNAVSVLFQDREQNVWVGTENGLDRFRKPRLRPIPLPAYQLMIAGPPIAGGPGGSAWADRFFIAAPDAVPQRFAPESDKTITALYRSPDGTVYGGGDTQLWTLGQTGLQAIPWPSGIPANTFAVALARDRAGALWVNFGLKTLYKWADGRWSRPQGLSGPESVSPMTISADSRGRIWVGFRRNQIALVTDDKVDFFGAADGLATDTVTQILPVNGHTWVGGENGLSHFDGKRFTTVRGRGEESFPGIMGLVIDREGTLWINGSTGISSITRTELQRALDEPGYPVRFRRIDYRDGLHGVAGTHYPAASAAISDNGTLWFATTGGVYTLTPETLPHNSLVPPVMITAMAYGGVDHVPMDGARLPAGTGTLRVDFTALSFQAPERMEFRYRLEGVDPDWRDSTGDRSAYYTNLGPGHYRFRVIASNNDGLWNTDGASVAFEIAPTVTQTLWFRALCVGAAVLVAWRLQVQWTRRAARRLAARMGERVAERERIARELHDTLLQSVQGLMMIFWSTAVRLAPRDRAPLESALARASQVVAEGRDLVAGLRTTAVGDGDLAGALRRYGEPLAQDNGIDFALRIDGKERSLQAAAADEAFAVAREAMWNTVCHAHASTITVTLRYTTAALVVIVADDGKGIPAAVVAKLGRPSHWGIPGMYERARTLGAALELASESNAGTRWTLRMPAAIAFA
jgi:signal transduction histidine kinase/ligand-binding sensor domain-containing protein